MARFPVIGHRFPVLRIYKNRMHRRIHQGEIGHNMSQSSAYPAVQIPGKSVAEQYIPVKHFLRLSCKMFDSVHCQKKIMINWIKRGFKLI